MVKNILRILSAILLTGLQLIITKITQGNGQMQIAIAPLLFAAIPAVYQGIKGIRQRRLAKRLKESKFIPPELSMNRDLALQQAYSRRAPGQGIAEENIRRSQANQMSLAQRVAGGDANKLAALSSGIGGQANTAIRSLQAQGQAFSENAFGRLGQANLGIALQKRQNRDEYNLAKRQLLAASDQNIFNAVNNLSTIGVASAIDANPGKYSALGQTQGIFGPGAGSPWQIPGGVLGGSPYDALNFQGWQSPGFSSGYGAYQSGRRAGRRSQGGGYSE